MFMDRAHAPASQQAARGKEGLFFIVMGPSGAGKSTLVQAVREACPDVQYIPSVTTRPPRPHEQPGKSYEFVDDATFDRLVAQGAFLEWARYGGHRYGTLRSAVEEGLAAGRTLIKEMEVQGVAQVVAALPREQVFLIFVDAGPWEALERRICARAPLSPEELAARRDRYEAELPWMERADAVIANPDGALEEAKHRIIELVCSRVRNSREQ